MRGEVSENTDCPWYFVECANDSNNSNYILDVLHYSRI